MLVLLVEEDGLEDVVVERLVLLLELVLERAAVEAHLQLALVAGVVLDQVHPASGGVRVSR